MKNILLIGGSYGIGHSIAQQLKESHNVIIASRTAEGIPEGVTHHTFDALLDDSKNLALPDTIHGFVYCPGSIRLKPFKRITPEHFLEDMNLNFVQMIRCLQGILPNLTAANHASIVLFSSVAVSSGMPFHTSVAASKGAIEGFAKALAAEYAPTVRVNVIAPSLTNTPLAERLLNSDEKKEKMAQRHPLKRVGEAEDIANLATFLLSDQSSWMTGQVLGLDGGMSTIN